MARINLFRNQLTYFIRRLRALIFTSQPNLVMESGIHSSLHSNCHHQIVFAKFNLSIFYPPPYEGTVWYYERANTELIRRAID